MLGVHIQERVCWLGVSCLCVSENSSRAHERFGQNLSLSLLSADLLIDDSFGFVSTDRKGIDNLARLIFFEVRLC